MKLVTFTDPRGAERLGALTGDDTIVDLNLAEERIAGAPSADFATMLALIDGGEPALERARELLGDPPDEARLPLADCRLLSPLPRPRQMRDFLSFELHLKQGIAAMKTMAAGGTREDAAKLATELELPAIWYRQPIYYKCNRFAISGPDDVVTWPSYSNVMDYELELAAVIGRKGKDIPKERAADYIFGYTIFNDFSARDAQSDEMEAGLGPAKGKDFDGANALGPCIVTSDEIPDPLNLIMISRINGEERSSGNSSTMFWKFEDEIAHVSKSETIYPGEIIASGTIGNGCGLEHMRFLEDGDEVELEIEGIGVLRNRVVRG